MVLNILIVIGVLTSVLSGVDFFLRPHQRQQVQLFLEDMTLQANELRPVDWDARIKEPAVQAVLVMLTYFELVLVMLLALLIQAPQWRAGGALNVAFGESGQTAQVVACLITVATLFWAWRWPLPQLMTYVLGGATRWSIRRRFAGVLVAGYAFFAAYQVLAIRIISPKWLFLSGIHHSRSWEQFAFMWSLLPVWPLFTIFWIVFQGVGIALQPRSWMTRGLFGLFKATMWRIIEYNKGAVAAIALLVTIGLTTLKLLLG